MKQFDKLCDIFWEPFLLHHKQRNGSQIPKREVHKKCCLRQNMTIVSSYLNNRNSHMSHLQTVKYWLHSIILECCNICTYVFVWLISFFVFRFGWRSYEKQKYFVIVCSFFLLFFIFVLPFLPCKRKTSYRKSRNLFSFLVTSSTKTKNEKWDEKLKSHDIKKYIITNLNCRTHITPTARTALMVTFAKTLDVFHIISIYLFSYVSSRLRN